MATAPVSVMMLMTPQARIFCCVPVRVTAFFPLRLMVKGLASLLRFIQFSQYTGIRITQFSEQTTATVSLVHRDLMPQQFTQHPFPNVTDHNAADLLLNQEVNQLPFT